jgi:hypothetical protein
MYFNYIIQIKYSPTYEQKDKLIQRKKNIQHAFWNEMGLKINQTLQGQGTSNTRNVARIFFKNAEKSTKITKK